MATMVDNVRDLVSPALVSVVSRQMAGSQVAVSKGLNAALTAIFSTVSSRADDLGFMSNLADLAAKSAAGSHPLDAIGALVPSPAGIDTSSPIGGWLSSLFGHNLSDVTDGIARYAGIDRSSAAALLAIAAPLALGYIGRLVRSDKLTVTGLADLLRGQRAEFTRLLPSSFRMPGVGAPYETGRTAVKERAATVWSVPLMALLAALGIGGLIWWARQQPVDVARVDIVEIEPLSSKGVGTAGTLPGTVARTVPGNVTINLPDRSVEQRLSMYLATAHPGVATFNIDRIAFDSDSAVLTADSNEQLENIAIVLRAYPRADVTIAGHTDSSGSEAKNLALSRARANAVAARLTAAGVSSDRVHAAGYGSEKPAADNSTEAGRAHNRRVELEAAVR
jgi:outer membrane protein OmpA-like peptidoglycan-associated protein